MITESKKSQKAILWENIFKVLQQLVSKLQLVMGFSDSLKKGKKDYFEGTELRAGL